MFKLRNSGCVRSLKRSDTDISVEQSPTDADICAFHRRATPTVARRLINSGFCAIAGSGRSQKTKRAIIGVGAARRPFARFQTVFAIGRLPWRLCEGGGRQQDAGKEGCTSGTSASMEYT
jgi:hypothetical protein